MIRVFAASPVPKIACHIVTKTIIFIGLALIPALSAAETPSFFAIIKNEPISEIWLNPGFYSYHVQRSKGLNDNNIGLGGEYRYSTISSVALGVYENSDRLTSRYVGWYWQPLAVGPTRFGAVVGVIDGYHNWNGNWFAAVIPAVSIEYKNIGANLLLIPSYKDKLYGSISLQLKLKVL